MKIIARRQQLSEAPELWLRRAGYGLVSSREAGQPSFARRLSRDFYPRFHIYFTQSGDEVEFSLHLDQKRPGYDGYHRHNAEYDGEVVEQEGARLKSLMLPDFLA